MTSAPLRPARAPSRSSPIAASSRSRPCSTEVSLRGVQDPLGCFSAKCRGALSSCAAMDFDLSDDHQLLRNTVRDFALGEVAPVAEELDRTKSFPYEIV